MINVMWYVPITLFITTIYTDEVAMGFEFIAMVAYVIKMDLMSRIWEELNDRDCAVVKHCRRMRKAALMLMKLLWKKYYKAKAECYQRSCTYFNSVNSKDRDVNRSKRIQSSSNHCIRMINDEAIFSIIRYHFQFELHF